MTDVVDIISTISMQSPEDKLLPVHQLLLLLLFDIAKILGHIQTRYNCSKGVNSLRDQTLKCKISVEAHDSSLLQISHLENKTLQN